MNKIIILVVASLISAVLYRLGGYGKPFKTWIRDWLVPPLTYLTFLFFWQPIVWYGWLLLLPAIILTGGALTTYWDWLFKEDNYWFSGFMVGLGTFPLIWAGLNWYSILLRAIVLALLWGGWCKIFSNDWVEETFRGCSIVFTLPLLLLLI